MPYTRLIIFKTPLYNNIVKISLRKLSIVFCAASKEYYGVKESPLDEHRDKHVDVKAKIAQKATLLLAK